MNKKLLNRAATIKLKHIRLVAQKAELLAQCEQYLALLSARKQTKRVQLDSAQTMELLQELQGLSL